MVRRLKDREYGSELLDVLHSLEHSNGVYEYYSFEQDLEYRIRIPKAAHPWEGNKSDLLRYVELKEGTENWFSTEGVYEDYEDAIRETAIENMEIIKSFERSEDKASKKLINEMEELGATGIVTKVQHMKPRRGTKGDMKIVVEWLLAEGFEYGDLIDMKTYQRIHAELGFHPRKTDRLLGAAGWRA